MNRPGVHPRSRTGYAQPGHTLYRLARYGSLFHIGGSRLRIAEESSWMPVDHEHMIRSIL